MNPVVEVYGQEPAASDGALAELPFTLQDVQERLARVEGDTALDESTRTTLVHLYQESVEALESRRQWIDTSRSYEQAREATPALLQSIQEQSDQLQQSNGVIAEAPESLPLMESHLIELESQLALRQEALGDLEREFQRRTDRRVALPGLRADARSRLSEIERQFAESESSAESTELADARLILLRAQRASLESEIQAYDNELASYEARGELLPARRDLAALELAQTEAEVRSLRDRVNEQRRREANEATRQAREAASRVHPVAGDLAVENANLARRRSGEEGLASRIEAATQQMEETDAMLTRVSSQYANVVEKVEAIGLTDAIGYLLRSKRGEIPPVGSYRTRNQARQAEIRSVQLDQIQLSEQRSELADQLEDRLNDILAELGSATGPRKRIEIELTLRHLLQRQLELLETLIRDTDRYFSLLIDLDTKEKALIEESEAFRAYIDERILWVPSGEPFGLNEFRRVGGALAWGIHPETWSDWIRSAERPRRNQALGLVLFFAPLFLLLSFRPSLRQKLRAEGKVASKGSTQSFVPTLKATGLTLLLATVRPGLFAWSSWVVHAVSGASPVGRALASGLLALAVIDVLVQFLEVLASEDGLGESHFNWPVRANERLRSTLRHGVAAGYPLMFLYAFLQAQPEEAWRESLGRLALVGGVGVLAFTLYQGLHPQRGVFLEYLRTHPDRWATRMQRLWLPVVVMTPLALAVIALRGYTYTADHLAQRLYGTGWLLILLFLSECEAQRWLLMTRRRILVEESRRKREQAQLDARVQSEGEPEPPAPPPEPEVDFSQLDSQARQMFHVGLGAAFVAGLWWVWVDVLPALGMLRQIELWSVMVPSGDSASLLQGGGETAGTLGGEAASALDRSVRITLADLILSLIFVVLTVVGVRNLPGLLEVTILQRLRLESSLKFAITALARYAMIVGGGVAAFGAIGIGWGKVQWLVAAMTVGLGFGLQEIFANFVSGLIILFERPIRIGDIVTVADVSGTVTRIRMRATTITDFDRKELIVPNKEFITGKLINWTLTDPVTRIMIPVGVAYGDDTDRALELLLEIARRNAHVLEDPEPNAVFMGFGDNSLDLRLYIFVPRRELYLEIMNQINREIDAAFKEAGITIAFPQRDLHVETLSPLEIRMVQTPSDAPEPST